MSDYAKISVAREGHVHTITLNAPERRNAIGPVMVNELHHALANANADAAARVVVLTGAGRAFCAGGDLAHMTSAPDVPELPFKGDYADLLLTMMRYDKPIVARVNGAAMGVASDWSPRAPSRSPKVTRLSALRRSAWGCSR